MQQINRTISLLRVRFNTQMQWVIVVSLVCVMIIASAAGTAYGISFAAMSLEQVVQQSEVIVVGKIERIDQGDQKEIHYTALVRVEKVLKNTTKEDRPVKVRDIVVVKILSNYWGPTGHTKGQKGVWLLGSAPGKMTYEALHPTRFQPLTKEAEICQLIKKQAEVVSPAPPKKPTTKPGVGAVANGEHISDEQLDRLIAELKNRPTRQSAAKKLLKLKGPRVVERLIAEVEGGNSSYYIIKALGKLGDPRAVKPLADRMYKDQEGFSTFYTVAQALCRIGDKQANSALKAALRNQNKKLRHTVAAGLGELGTPQVLEFFNELLKSKTPEHRITGVLGYCRIDAGRARDVLVASLDDLNGYVRFYAARGLQKMGDERAVPVLIDSLGHTDRVVWWEAAQILKNTIAARLKGTTGKARLTAAKSLAEIAGKSGTNLLESFIKMLGNVDGKARLNAVKALGALGDKRAIRPLIPMLTDDWHSTRSPALNALNGMGWKPQNRSDKVRSLIAARKWSEVAKTAQVITPADGASNEVQGTIVFDEPILLHLKDFTGSTRREHGQVSIPWIEFLKDKNKLRAKIELGHWEGSPKFLITARLFDPDGKILAHDNGLFVYSGLMCRARRWRTDVVGLSFGDWGSLSKASTFHVSVKKIPFGATQPATSPSMGPGMGP